MASSCAGGGSAEIVGNFFMKELQGIGTGQSGTGSAGAPSLECSRTMEMWR